MKLLAQALLDDPNHQLKLRLSAGARGLMRVISEPRIQKPGLAIAGFIDAIRPGRVQVLGNTEHMYLRTLGHAEQISSLRGLFAADVSCVVLTNDLAPMPAIDELAEAYNVPVLCTPLSSGAFITRVHEFLGDFLSPEITVHGVLVDVFGVGVLLTGRSGVGKSECALDLILRGHRLVSDDTVVVKRRDDQLIASGSALTMHHMEVRGLGIINVQDLFGAASVCERKHIALVVEMMAWHENAAWERMGIDDECQTILDLPIPKLRLPILPGRNVASIVEVAVRNHLLKARGHHAARRFKEALENKLLGGNS